MKKILFCLPFLAISILSCSISNKNIKLDYDSNLKQAIYKFPSSFLWGTATASYQVEGGITNDWSTNKLDAGKASEHYEKFEEDFKFAKSINNNAYRFSIEWARIEPEQGHFDLKEVAHYKKVLKSLKENGLKPMVTLHHFTNPVWLAKMGGWENEKAVQYFDDYVKFIVNELKDEVDLWLTINEPNVYAFKAYDAGEWPPYKKERKLSLLVMGNLLKAHYHAYHTIHDIYKEKPVKVGYAHHIAILHPYFRINPLDNLMTHFINKVFNEGFWNSIDTGKIDLNIPGVEGVNEPYNEKLKNSMDFVGFNYYTRWMVNSKGEQFAKPDSELTDIGWEIYPEGISEAIEIANKYSEKRNLPIYITENGIDDANDAKRKAYLVSHLKKVWESIQNNRNIKGYIYWTLMDNFEWAEKYKPKFGFMTIDRTARPSAQVFSDICKNNGVREGL